MFEWGLRQNAVTKIEDMRATRQRPDDLDGAAFKLIASGQQ